MSLTGKIKQALHLNKDKDKATDGTSDAEGTTQTSETAKEPLTGPEAYQPLKKNEPTHATTTDNSQAGTGSTGTGSGQVVDGTQATKTTGTGKPEQFVQSYKEDEPGYSSKFKAGEPQYTEKVRQGDGALNADLTASADNKHWEEARELTLAAEREVASAQLSGNKASKELLAAQEAEKAVRQAQLKHREALEEAEKHRAVMNDSGLKEQDLADAQSLYQSRRNAADEAGRSLKDAETDLATKQRDYESLRPHLDKHGQAVPGLEDELAARQKERADAEGNRDNLLLAAKDAEADHAAHRGDLDALQRELEQQERLAAEKQQEYINARNAAQNTAQRVDALKTKLRDLDDQLLGHRGRVQDAEESLPAYKEAELRAQKYLEDAHGEWDRLKALEDEYGRNYSTAHDRYKNARSAHDPASKELQDSHSILQARQDDLDRARNRATAAERKYKELLALADKHKKYGDSAADAATTHGEKYEALKQEANIHGDKHAEYWNAAQQQGQTGSNVATDAIHKLEEKVESLVHKNEP